MTANLQFQSSYGPAAIYDSTRSALSLIDRLERCGELTDQQKSLLLGATSALHAAESAAGEAVRIT